MSSSKTAKLGLNQWQRSDFLIMDDFNADNAKLDAAVGAMPWWKLREVTTAATAAQVDIDLTGIDLSQYWDVIVYARLKCAYVYLRINNLGSGHYTYGDTNGGFSGGNLQLFNIGVSDGSMISMLHLQEYKGSAACWLTGMGDLSSTGPACYYNSAGAVDVPLQSVTSLNLIAANSSTIAAGSKIAIFGLK